MCVNKPGRVVQAGVIPDYGNVAFIKVSHVSTVMEGHRFAIGETLANE